MKRLIAIALVMRYQNVLGLFTHQNVLGLFTHQTTYVTNWPVRQGFAKVSSTIYIYIYIYWIERRFQSEIYTKR
ncbi:MAG: hypothetical protein HQ474_01830 [Flammeovirgaceae bacterium]|nr:hypothetical protein [Flammeovirgaceae bacterium]